MCGGGFVERESGRVVWRRNGEMGWKCVIAQMAGRK
jgi:hypothetical protein